jgi:hypothetical protein
VPSHRRSVVGASFFLLSSLAWGAPANSPPGYVVTPVGLFHSSCILEVAPGERVHRDRIERADGTSRGIPPCAYPHYDSRRGDAPAPAPSDAGFPGNTWVANMNTRTPPVGFLSANWQVPDLPPVITGQTDYYFPGLQGEGPGILQPVLAFNEDGNNQWSIGSWGCCVGPDAGFADHGPLVPVNPGDALLGTMSGLGCDGGGCQSWSVETTDLTSGQASTLVTEVNQGEPEDWVFGGVLEEWYATSCQGLPQGVLFSQLLVEDVTGAPLPLPWSPFEQGQWQSQCGVSAWASADEVQIGTGIAVGLTAAPAIFVNQDASTSSPVFVSPVDALTGTIALSVASSLPSGVAAGFSPSSTAQSSQLTFTATANAATGLFPVNLQGSANGATERTMVNLASSAATGTGGQGTPVDLSPAYDVFAMATDGNAFAGSGLDGDGYAYSATLLTGARVLDGIQFLFGPPDQLDAVRASGQVLALPPGSFTTLWLLATGLGSNVTSQAVTVQYSDGTADTFTQGFSNWSFPETSTGSEVEAVAMPYRTIRDGGLDGHIIQNLYAYSFPVNALKGVQSLVLPRASQQVVLLAATLAGGTGAPDGGTSSGVDGGAATDAGTRIAADAGGGAVPTNKGCGCSGADPETPLLWAIACLLGSFPRARKHQRMQLSRPDSGSLA